MIRVLAGAVLVAVLGVLPVAPAGSGVRAATVINEVAAGTYLELRNVSSSTVDIGGFSLWLCDARDVVARARLAVGARLEPGEFFVFASSAFTGAAVDQSYPGPIPNGGAMLLDTGYSWVDGAAVVPGSPCGAGNPAPRCPQHATARDAGSTNTGDNGADFTCRRMSPGEPNP